MSLILEAEQSEKPDRLRELAEHSSARVRAAAAENRHADDATVGLLIRDASDRVRSSAAGNLRARPDVQPTAIASPDRWVRAILASVLLEDDSAALSPEVQEALARDEFFETRARVARGTDSARLFEKLLADPHASVRAHCAGNPRITRGQMERLITDPQKKVRAIAVALGLRYPDDEQLLRLASDRSADVRWAVIFRVDRPREALQMIAEDSDEMNRMHAANALVDPGRITAEQVVVSTRAERARANRMHEFA